MLFVIFVKLVVIINFLCEFCVVGSHYGIYECNQQKIWVTCVTFRNLSIHPINVWQYLLCFNQRHLLSYSITGLDRPLRYQEVEVSTVSGQSAHEGGKDVNPTFNLREISLVLIFRTDWVDLSFIVRPEWSSKKIPMTPSVPKPATFRNTFIRLYIHTLLYFLLHVSVLVDTSSGISNLRNYR